MGAYAGNRIGIVTLIKPRTGQPNRSGAICASPKGLAEEESSPVDRVISTLRANWADALNEKANNRSNSG